MLFAQAILSEITICYDVCHIIPLKYYHWPREWFIRVSVKESATPIPVRFIALGLLGTI